ncbi:MAG: glycosyltransferase family 39 protein [Alistipes sp.]|nr:glycosyltransferase family 39 protein [Alistipes sp.]
MKRKLSLLAIAIFVALLPIMVLRDYTPSNELRYLSIADEAIEQGNIFAFTNQGAAYADKPPVYFWYVMLGKVLFGEHLMWFLSLLSIVPALVILWVMSRWTAPWLDERTRISGALMTMCSGLFLGLAVVLRMDMLMCMFITLALYAFWQEYSSEGNSSKPLWLFPLYTFLALFTKGPVGVLVPILSALLFCAIKRRWQTMGRIFGWRFWLVLLSGCGVWFGAVYIDGGADYLNNLLFHQTIDRAVDAFHHKEPWYYYLISVWYSVAPFSLLAVGVVLLHWACRKPMSDIEQLFSVIIASTFVMLSVFSSKLAVYLAPTFPFIIFLALLFMQGERVKRWHRIAVTLPAAIFALAPVAALVAPHVAELPIRLSVTLWAAIILLGAGGLGTILLVWRRESLHAATDALSATLLAAAFVGGMALPQLNPEMGYGALCREAMRMAESHEAEEFFTWNIRRPENMDVYLGRDIVQVSTAEILSGRCNGSVVMLSKRHLASETELREALDSLPATDTGGYRTIYIPTTSE